jgi:hypothetical protein
VRHINADLNTEKGSFHRRTTCPDNIKVSFIQCPILSFIAINVVTIFHQLWFSYKKVSFEDINMTHWVMANTNKYKFPGL